MFQNNPLLAQLKQQIQENLPRKEGIVKASDKGFGMLDVDNKTRFFIPPPYMKKCMHGDRVTAFIRTENEKEFAEPQELIEPTLTRFIGRVAFFKGKLNIVPDHPQLKKLSIKANVARGLNPESLAENDWVVAQLIHHPLEKHDPQTPKSAHFLAEITEKITDANDKIAPWWVTLAANNLPNCEPKGPDSWQLKDDPDLERIDITDVPFVTIDGASTKDMDDALFAKKTKQGDIELTIAIADPTAYITPDDAMDQIARQRGFTIYLPGRNIPMLPRDLADELCSLMENEVRPALCCTVTVFKDGTLGNDARFFAANIKSHARLMYDHVSDWLDHGTSTDWQPNDDIASVVRCLYDFSLSRIQWRETHAVVFPDHPDYRFELSDDNDVIAIHADMRRSANRLVEEAMIAANCCAGELLKTQFEQGVFNTHLGFKPEKIAQVIALVDPNGELAFSEERLNSLEGFVTLRQWLAQQDTQYLDHRIRKCQLYSDISNTPLPHYAMGLDIYATWTSPIRKYGDMVNHRMLKAYILGKEPVQRPDETIGQELIVHRKHHKAAERNISDWLYSLILADEPTKKTVFNAEIFDINRAGMRVRLTENGATAFIPSSFIEKAKDRIVCHAEHGTVHIDQVLIFKLGDHLDIVLVEVNQSTRSLIAKPTSSLSESTTDITDTSSTADTIPTKAPMSNTNESNTN